MKALIDKKGIQAKKHGENKRRLKTFLDILRDLSISYKFSACKGITRKELERHNLLIITTRYPKKYSKRERKNICNFVQSGGSLLLMSNHGDLPGKNPHDTRKHDKKLASKFNVKIERTWFKNKQSNDFTTLTKNSFNNGHPIIRGLNSSVKSIVINNCSSITTAIGKPIVSLSAEMEDKIKNLPYKDRYFAVSLDEFSQLDPKIKGRVVITTDSGFIGNKCTNNPGPGLIEKGDNSIFIKNTLLWLLKRID